MMKHAGIAKQCLVNYSVPQFVSMCDAFDFGVDSRARSKFPSFSIGTNEARR